MTRLLERYCYVPPARRIPVARESEELRVVRRYFRDRAVGGRGAWPMDRDTLAIAVCGARYLFNRTRHVTSASRPDRSFRASTSDDENETRRRFFLGNRFSSLPSPLLPPARRTDRKNNSIFFQCLRRRRRERRQLGDGRATAPSAEFAMVITRPKFFRRPTQVPRDPYSFD